MRILQQRVAKISSNLFWKLVLQPDEFAVLSRQQLEVFVYQFLFELHQHTFQFLQNVSRAAYHPSAELDFLVAAVAPALALFIWPRTKIVVVLLAAAIASLPLLFKLALHGLPSMYVPSFGPFTSLSYALTALSGLTLCVLVSIYSNSRGYVLRKVGYYGWFAIAVSVIPVLSTCLVLSIFLIPPVTYEENLSSYTAWLSAHLTLRFLLLLAILSFFNYLGQKRDMLGRFVLQGAGIFIGAISILIVYRSFTFILSGLFQFLQSTSSSSAI